MRVLISAIACHPEHGSEAGIGWKAVTTLAKNHDVHVLTSEANRPAVEAFQRAQGSSSPSFTYFGTDAPYHENRLVARVQSWLRYIRWTEESLPMARRLLARGEFDLVHHVTYSSWRVASPLWQLDLPFVWGPVGGVGVYPWHLLANLSKRSAAFEVARGLSNSLASNSPRLRNCIRRATAVVASNNESLRKVGAMRGTSEGLHKLSPAFFTPEQIAAFRCDPAVKAPEAPIRLFAGGNLIGAKGIVFALEAVGIATARGIPCHFIVASAGPEAAHLQQVAHQLNLSGIVDFHVGFSGSAYIDKLKESHVFLLPSFRENAPGTIMEAMLAGCVPVVVDASAQGEIVSADCGFKIPIGSAAQISLGLADALTELSSCPERRISMGRAASNAIACGFSEENYRANLDEIYRGVTARRSPKAAI